MHATMAVAVFMVGAGVFGCPQQHPKIPQEVLSAASRWAKLMAVMAVIEDEDELRAAVRDTLERHGYEVVEGASIAAAKTLAPQVELLLLDLGLPDGDGLGLCMELAPIVPLIVISARGDEADRVAALEMGADDYLAKPFSTRELVARCRSVLRRGQRSRAARVVAADLAIDIETFEVERDGAALPLTTKERELLGCLAAQLGRPVRRQDLAERVWGASLGYVTRSLDVHVSSLRHKLGARPDGQGYIDTVHGVGYRLLP
jgi:DNA-binding response OmpR family regulator